MVACAIASDSAWSALVVASVAASVAMVVSAAALAAASAATAAADVTLDIDSTLVSAINIFVAETAVPTKTSGVPAVVAKVPSGCT